MRVLYFASLKESLGLSEEVIDSQVSSVAQLLTELSERGSLWKSLLEDNTRLQVAVNQRLARRDTAIFSQDEIAFFPPVTGG